MTRLRGLWSESSGYSLVEMLVYVGLLTSLVSIMSVGLSQALNSRPAIVDDGLAAHEVRRSLSWFAEDVEMAREADLTGGVLTLTWTNYFEDEGTDHTVTYALVGDNLVRTYDGVALEAARGVATATFAIDARAITAQVEINAKRDETRTGAVKALMMAESP